MSTAVTMMTGKHCVDIKTSNFTSSGRSCASSSYSNGTVMMRTYGKARGRRQRHAATSSSSEEGSATKEEEKEDDFEQKLGQLRGKRSKRSNDGNVSMVTGLPLNTQQKSATKSSSSKMPGVRDFMSDFTEEPKTKEWGVEKIFYEGPPARGEVVANVLMSWTLVWLPLTIQAMGRALWSSYKITDKRVSVISNSPLRKERTDVPMDQIKDCISIGRGIGAWGDMVITMRNNEKIELRSLPDFKTIEKEIKERMFKEKIIEF